MRCTSIEASVTYTYAFVETNYTLKHYILLHVIYLKKSENNNEMGAAEMNATH